MGEEEYLKKKLEKMKKRNKEKWNEIILEVCAWIFLIILIVFIKEFLIIENR
jgi:ABC-type phosphate transport system permease subunit